MLLSLAPGVPVLLLHIGTSRTCVHFAAYMLLVWDSLPQASQHCSLSSGSTAIAGTSTGPSPRPTSSSCARFCWVMEMSAHLSFSAHVRIMPRRCCDETTRLHTAKKPDRRSEASEFRPAFSSTIFVVSILWKGSGKRLLLESILKTSVKNRNKKRIFKELYTSLVSRVSRTAATVIVGARIMVQRNGWSHGGSICVSVVPGTALR